MIDDRHKFQVPGSAATAASGGVNSADRFHKRFQVPRFAQADGSGGCNISGQVLCEVRSRFCILLGGGTRQGVDLGDETFILTRGSYPFIGLFFQGVILAASTHMNPSRWP